MRSEYVMKSLFIKQLYKTSRLSVVGMTCLSIHDTAARKPKKPPTPSQSRTSTILMLSNLTRVLYVPTLPKRRRHASCVECCQIASSRRCPSQSCYAQCQMRSLRARRGFQQAWSQEHRCGQRSCCDGVMSFRCRCRRASCGLSVASQWCRTARPCPSDRLGGIAMIS